MARVATAFRTAWRAAWHLGASAGFVVMLFGLIAVIAVQDWLEDWRHAMTRDRRDWILLAAVQFVAGGFVGLMLGVWIGPNVNTATANDYARGLDLVRAAESANAVAGQRAACLVEIQALKTTLTTERAALNQRIGEAKREYIEMAIPAIRARLMELTRPGAP